ncbi:glycoside hydrolase [Multifurca ochricompacta]|uniref:Glycoside hydrolase n=1 Tax=Multifurca ochricompacta TaxID=376703 RepID=A0AAD4M2R3_9AGAM|nr:glycoside hydrolase [Multifurca ochricompacta]
MELTDEIRREIGQHFVVGFNGYDASYDIQVLIKDYHVGSVRSMWEGAKQVHALVQKLQQIAKDAGHQRPLMIGTDQENGLVSAFSVARSDEAGTQFPGAMALAAAGSPDLAERISEASALELKLAGINWAYSPVADVNSDPRNPVIGGIRAVPEEVAKYVAAALIAPSPKHFPGHGDTQVDSHISLPIISKDAASLAKTDLIPFQTASDVRAATIMVGHMALPSITGDNTPASLSNAVVTDLLCGSLGYDGVVVTDCLEMEAVAEREGGVPRAAVDALRAGADIAMICHSFVRQKSAIEEAYRAIQDGSLDKEMLRASGRRIAVLKDTFAGDWSQIIGTNFDEMKWDRLKTENLTLSRQTYASSIALIRDPDGVIPLPKSAGVVVLLTPRMESLNLAVADADGVPRKDGLKLRNTAGPSYLALAESISKRVKGASLHDVYTPEEPFSTELEDAINHAASVLFVTRSAERSTWQLDRLREVLRLRKVSRGVVVLASYGPYDLLMCPLQRTVWMQRLP